MGDFMAYDHTDAAQLLFVIHVLIVVFAAQDTGRDGDVVIGGAVFPIDRVSGPIQVIPDGPVHSGTDLRGPQLSQIFIDRAACLQQAAAILRPSEVECRPVSRHFRICDVHTQGIQLFDGYGAGLFTQPVLRFQHDAIGFKNLIDDIMYVLTLLLRAIGLNVKVVQRHGQQIGHGVKKRSGQR